MRIHKLIAAAVTAVCMCACLCTAANAVDLDDERFKDKTWEQVVEEFLAEHDADTDSVTAGYYNTVTGEEHYLNGDQYMFAASVIKLPTNMLYAERIYNGEMSWNTMIRGNTYELIQYSTLVHSDNALTDDMIMDLGKGSFYNFRHVILPYVGLTEETVTDEFINTNVLTPKQIMYTLKLLYNDPDRYPGVIDKMLQANPGWYFKSGNTEFKIAHKYGWLTYHGVTYLNDCGIIYTDDPILLCLFTGNVDNALTLLGEFADLMADYAQYHRVQRYALEAAETSVPAVGTPLQALTPGEEAFDLDLAATALTGCGLLLTLIGVILLCKKKKSAILVLVAALILVGTGAAPMAYAEYTVTTDKPAAMIEALAQWLTDAEHTDTLTAQAAESFTLTADTPVRDELRIEVPVTATKVDISAVNESVAQAYTPALTVILEAGKTALYDEEGSFLSDAADAAAQQSVDAVTAAWDQYLVTESGTVTLQLTLDGWTVCIDEELIKLCSLE